MTPVPPAGPRVVSLLDQAVLAIYKPLGVEPGKEWNPGSVAKLDGERLRHSYLGRIGRAVAPVFEPIGEHPQG